jgi:hypothetical protein
MTNIKNFEGWRAEQMAKVFLSKFDNLLISESFNSGLDFIVGVEYKDIKVEKLFGIEVKAGKNRSWFTKKLNENKDVYNEFNFPILIFLFDMDTDKGYFSWIKKPVSEAKFTAKFQFYQLTDKRMEGLIGTIENWYFEKHNNSFINKINETWKNIDNRKLKVHDRIYFSCSEEWEVDTLRDKILENYPSYSKDYVNNAIESCCKSQSAPFERLAFENCVLMKLRYKI